MTEPQISLRGVSLERQLVIPGQGRLVKTVLNDINLTISSGERVGIVGMNGSGKSTLLRLMAGIYWPDAGEVKCKGEVATMFDAGFGLDHRLSGRRNCETRAILNKIPRKKRNDFVRWVDSFAELGDYFELPLSTYSSGMLTRLAFSLSVFESPDILLIDEGIGTADFQFRERAFSRLDEICEQSSVVVFVSHDKEILRQRCTRGILLEEGRVKVEGELNSVLSSY